MKRTLVLLGIITVLGLPLNAQQEKPRLSFDSQTHDFGKIRENGGKVTHEFTFTNTGNQPLIINEVKASCGCTSPSWSKQPIRPGNKGFVSATFDPRRRPGNFNKSILVTTNASNGTVILRIKGEVLRKKRTLSDQYPRQMGDLRLKSHHLAFVKVRHNALEKDSLAIVNDSDELMSLSFTGVPEHLELYTGSKVLKPGEESFIFCKYDASRINDWGFRMDQVRIKVNGNHVPHNTLVVSAKIVEDFSHLTPGERKNAPSVEFENTTYNFKTAKQNSEVEHVFRFKNTGRSDLKIRKIRTTCGCTTVTPDKKVIGPGESSSFKAIFHTENRRGYQDKSIHFISNDPDNSNLRLSIKGKVEK